MYLIVGWLIAAALLLSPRIVYACHDENDARDMNYSTATVSVGLTGVTQYTFNGSCSTSGSHSGGSPIHSGFSFSASGVWDPGNKQAQERVDGQGSWNVKTTWSCPTDPWLQRVTCTQQSFVGSEGAPVLASDTPFSATQQAHDQLCKEVNKAMPKPPGLPPRDVKAVIRSPLSSGGRAHVFWGIPADQTSMHRTVAWFEVERRPAG